MTRTLFTLGLIISLILCCAAFTCQHKAMQTSVGVAASLKAMQDGEIALHDLGKIDDTEHALLQRRFRALFQTDKDVRQCIYVSGGPACADIGIGAVNAMLKEPVVVGIKNPDSRAQIELLGQGVITSLNALKAAL